MMMTQMKSRVAGSIAPSEFTLSVLQVLGGSLFLALCSQIKIPLPFSIIPITLQTFCVLMFGAVFGSRKASLMILAYGTQILMGLPVLPGGLSNPFILIGPKGGYYLGFLVQAYCMGWLIERSNEKSSKRFLQAGLIACAIQLMIGVCWLSHFIGLQTALLMGLYPFIPGEILKVLAVNLFVKKIGKIDTLLKL